MPDQDGAPAPELERTLSDLSQQLAELRGHLAELSSKPSPLQQQQQQQPQTPWPPQQHQQPQPQACHAATAAGSGAGAGAGQSLTHVDAGGRAAMVDVSSKGSSTREARASCRVLLGPKAFGLVQSNSLSKGDVLTVAQLAGITGAKCTPQLIPLCHTLLLSKVDVALSLDPSDHSVAVTSMARTVGQTGVEMEALTAAAVAALTVYDMCKAVSKDAVITDLQLDFKSGGKSGTYHRTTHAQGG